MRATFEDRILMSDIVFVRTWFQVSVPKYFNSVTSLLCKDKRTWNGMRTVGQIRFETGTKPKPSKDSLYRPINRETRRFNPLRVPASLQKQLPFKTKPKLMEKRTGKRVSRAVVLEPGEKKVVTLIQQLATLHRDKAKRRKQKQDQKHRAFLAEKAKQQAKQLRKTRELKKEFYRDLGKDKARKKRKVEEK